MTQHGTHISWVAVDWGTSHLRLWLMSEAGEVIERLSSDKGMGCLARDAFEPALISMIEPYLSEERALPVVCCGMVGSRQGWQEAPYVATPCSLREFGGITPVTVQDKRIKAFIVAGVKQAEPADVMRGEETQIAGVLRDDPDFTGIICLPGTHTKWVFVTDGTITAFQTFMTGETFSLLSKSSVLKHSVTSDGWDDAVFRTSLEQTVNEPSRFAASLFSVRANDLLNAVGPAAGRAKLSGHLIGAEIAAMREQASGQSIRIVGAVGLSDLYAKALKSIGVDATLDNADEITLAGLKAVYECLGANT